MRYAWVDKGQNPDWNKATSHQLTGFFMPMFSTTKTQLQDIVNHGKAVGIYMAWNWAEFAGKSGKETAAICVDQWNSYGISALRLQLDIEAHDPVFITDALNETRRLLPNVGLSWTFEPQQGGWFTQELIGAIIGTKTRAVPQLYNGAMTIHWDSFGQTVRLVNKGIPAAQVTPMYDGQKVGERPGWDGYVFTQGRLP